MQEVIGIDLGGTTIKGGRLDGDVLKQTTCLPSRSEIGGDVTMSVLFEVIESLLTPDTKAIGLGVASVVDRNAGIGYDFSNIRNWEKVEFKATLEPRYGLPVSIDNDANCFALSERRFGKGQKYSDFVGITLGTGLGGGIIKNGALISDTNCGSGEFGFLPYKDSIFEDYCSSKFFVNNYGESGLELAQKANSGNAEAIRAFHEFGEHLGQLVKVIMYTVDPQAVIFGGAISKSFQLFYDGLKESMMDFAYPRALSNIIIEPSDMSQSGIFGAASLCL